MSEVIMLAPTNAPSHSVERKGGPQQAIMRPIGSYYRVPVQENQIERLTLATDSLRTYNHRGTVVVASAWLALYIIMAISDLTASLN
jgi:hypothetical protein